MNEQTIIAQVRERMPLIHHLTNQVVMNFSANGLLSFGGTPIMGKYIESVADIATKADAVLLNMGTLSRADLTACIKAGKSANRRGIPVIFDPVGIASSAFNKEAGREILSEVKLAAIKGNAGEMAYLAGIKWETRGVDSIGQGNAGAVAQAVAAKYDTVAAVTGKVDYVSDGKQLFENNTGHPLLAKITGSGCLLGSIIAACLTTDGEPLEQTQSALFFYGLAGQFAASRPEVRGPGTFLPVFIDALSYDILDMEEASE